MIVDKNINYVLSKVRLRVSYADDVPPGPRLGTQPYCTMKEMCRFLNEHGLHYGGAYGFVDKFITDKEQKSVESPLSLGDNDALLTVRSKTLSNQLHAVVWDATNKVVLDPQHENPQQLSDYELVDWANICTLSDV